MNRAALFLAYDFPPCLAPGAAVRTANFVHHLPDFGWNPHILCRDEHLPDPQAHPSLLRVPSPFPARLSYQLSAWIWAARIRAHALSLAQTSAPSLIYATSPPFPHALVALALGRRLRLPVVIDLRDSWALDPHTGGGPLQAAAKSALCRFVYPPLEAQLFQHAHALLMNTPSMEREYRRLYPHAAPRIHPLPNGFDESAFADCPPPPPRPRPLFLYCGRFAGIAARSPDLLLHGMRLALDQGLRFDLHILGDDSPLVRRAIRRFQLEDFVHPRPQIAYPSAIRAICAADALVVCQAPGHNPVTPIAGKTFEYLRAGRPILALTPEGDNANLVRQFAAASAVVTTQDPSHVATAFATLLPQLGPHTVHPEFAAQYNRRHLASQLASLFDQLCP